MKSIYHELRIAAPVESVYDAITTREGLSGWWTPHTTAKPETGSIARFAFDSPYFKEMKVVKLEPPHRVEWLCVNGYQDWIGTTITFEVNADEKGTVLFFHHDGWKEFSRGFAGCTYDWAIFLRSLRSLCETGKGTPFPDHHSLTS
jgi:uncharacterized protein YndB with AHSA1/START domain